jgi:hypothetical protein
MAGTRWVKIDTSYLRNPKIVSVSTPLLHLASILWTAEQLTDGEIPARTLRELGVQARVSSTAAIRRRADELVEHGLWIPNGAGWHLHDFEEMNPQAMRAAVEKQRAKWKGWQDTHRRGDRL